MLVLLVDAVGLLLLSGVACLFCAAKKASPGGLAPAAKAERKDDALFALL